MTPEARVSLTRATDDSEKKTIDDVRRHGVHILHIFDPEGADPQFSYTVGLWHTHGHPEVLIFGLKQDLCHAVLNWINGRIGEGRSFRGEDSSLDVLEGFRTYFEQIPQDRFREYLGFDIWFYGGMHFEAVQMIWPNTSGCFPWESQASDQLRWTQPILTKRPTLVS